MIRNKKKLHLSALVPSILLAAVEFDKTYFPIPARECNEKLVSVEEIFKRENLPYQVNREPTITGQLRLFYLREGLIEPLLEVIRDLRKKGYILRFEYMYRRLEDQKGSFERSIKAIILKYPQLEEQEILKVAGVFSAATPNTAAHVSGAAIDVTLLDEKLHPVDMVFRTFFLVRKVPQRVPKCLSGQAG